MPSLRTDMRLEGNQLAETFGAKISAGVIPFYEKAIARL